mmetsp:Transcript_52852/g.147163  ORF Transcript_52852/g.147163 Transcript_52852/m.147163 type:complete len:329 (-) Transcript_52852:69-1055(-)
MHLGHHGKGRVPSQLLHCDFGRASADETADVVGLARARRTSHGRQTPTRRRNGECVRAQLEDPLLHLAGEVVVEGAGHLTAKVIAIDLACEHQRHGRVWHMPRRPAWARARVHHRHELVSSIKWAPPSTARTVLKTLELTVDLHGGSTFCWRVWVDDDRTCVSEDDEVWRQKIQHAAFRRAHEDAPEVTAANELGQGSRHRNRASIVDHGCEVVDHRAAPQGHAARRAHLFTLRDHGRRLQPSRNAVQPDAAEPVDTLAAQRWMAANRHALGEVESLRRLGRAFDLCLRGRGNFEEILERGFLGLLGALHRRLRRTSAAAETLLQLSE